MIKLSSILFVTATLTGCTDDDDDDRGFLPPETETVEWRADIVGSGANAAIRGDAHVMTAFAASTFMAAAEIQFDTPFVGRPWHVHVGSCATSGAIVGPPASYPVLRTNDRGRDDANVEVPARIDPAGAYHVNVHASAAELETIIACGDFRLIEP